MLERMSDFFQDGSITTLHRLGEPDPVRLERELRDFAEARRLALVLPCHARELESAALGQIVRELAQISYLDQIVVGIDGADSAAWHSAQEIFSPISHRALLIWNNGPRIQSLLRKLVTSDLDPGPIGKGRNLWLATGCVLAHRRCNVIASHDCDITTYSRDMLARLCYPVMNPALGFEFCKGFSARFSDRLNGRVMRLLLTPLLRTLASILGPHEFFDYLNAFRYPLSGEVCMNVDVLRRARVPSDWGVEIGLLTEVYRSTSPRQICQVDVADVYDHKHQDLSFEDPTRGLNRMAGEIVRCLFKAIGAQAISLDRRVFNTVLAAYAARAGETLHSYAADAALNGLHFDRRQEEVAIATFTQSVRRAADEYLNDPLQSRVIPDWNCVESALPDFLPALLEAVGLDQEEARSAHPRLRLLGSD